MLNTIFNNETLFYNALFKNKLIGISVADGFTILEVNEAFCHMMGFTRDELLKRKVIDITIDSQKDDTEKCIEKLINKEVEYYTITKKYRHKTGRIIHVETTVNGVYDTEGNYLMSIALHNDITDKISYNKKLMAREALLRGMFENSPVGFSIGATNSGYIGKTNPKISEILGYTEEELKNIPVKKLTYPDDRQKHLKPFRKLLDGEVDSFELEKRYIHKTGKVVWAKTNVSLIRTDEGETLHDFAIIEDITRKKKYERKLRDRDAFFRQMFNNSPVGLSIGTINSGYIGRVNSKVSEILGYSEDELKTIPVKKLTYPSDRKKHIKPLQKLINNEIDSFELEKRYIHKSGRIVWAKTTVSLIRTADGKAINDFAIIQDITERKRYEKKLKENNKMLKKMNRELDHFVYRTSHDLKAPLSSILGLIGLARVDQESDHYKIYEAIESQIKRLEFFIEEIIDYSRASRAENMFSEIDFNKLINTSFKDNKYINGNNSLKTSLTIEGDDVFRTDLSKLKIVFNNLISNSIKYSDKTKAESYISVKVNITSKEARIEIEDNGIGIKNEHKSKLFSMFYRATNESTGSGLGLYIVKEALESIKGKIKVNSEYGVGTTMYISIPNKK